MSHDQHATSSKKQEKEKELVSLIRTATSSAARFVEKNSLSLLPIQSIRLEHLLSLFSPPSPSPAPECWFLRLLNSPNSDQLWPTFFHMSKPTFSLLLSLLSPSLSSSLPSIPPSFSLAATLYRLAHNAPYHALVSGFRFHSPDQACRVFFIVCKAVNEKMGFLVGFDGGKECVLNGFREFGLLNCCGVLGFGRFGNGSVLVQGLVDSRGRFLDLSAGWPDGLKPDFILCRSKLFEEVREMRGLVNGPGVEIGDGKVVSQYVVGDGCFPLLPWLLTPYRIVGGNGKEKVFNSVHRDAMGMVKLAFRRVRERWRLLGKRWKEECFEYLPYVILMGCVLHNFLIKHDDVVFDGNDAGFSMEMEEEEEELPVFEGGLDESGKRIRDMVAEHLSQVNPRQ